VGRNSPEPGPFSVVQNESRTDFPQFYFHGEAPVAKWQTRRSAKPVFAGSIPARRSKKNSVDHLECSRGFLPILFTIHFEIARFPAIG
jgi:hypothetical protein